MHFELSHLIVWIAPWIVNTYSEFQVDIVSNNRDITKRSNFSKTMTTMTLDNDNAKTMAISRVLSENSLAKRPNAYQSEEKEWQTLRAILCERVALCICKKYQPTSASLVCACWDTRIWQYLDISFNPFPNNNFQTLPN